MQDGWDEIVDRILPAKEAEKLEMHKQFEKERAIGLKQKQAFVNAAKEAYGFEKIKDVTKFLEDSGEVQDLGVFTNARGENVTLELSTSEARSIWMMWQAPELKETLTSKDGNALTDEMLNKIFGLLSPEDKDFSTKVLGIYDKFYNDINKVYSKIFGVNLNKRKFYSPIAREHDKKLDKEEFFKDIQYRSRVAAGSALKTRVDTIAALKVRPDIQVYNNHVNEMARFIALREKTELLNSIFSDRKVRGTLEATRGKDFMKAVDDHLDSFARGAVTANNVMEKLVNTLNRNFSASVLGLKPKIGVAQLSSWFAYGEFMPASALVKGTRDFFKGEWKEAIEVLGSTAFMQTRGANPDVDIQRMGKTFSNRKLKKIQDNVDNLTDYALIFTKLGDRFTIYTGGWALYKHVLKETGSKEKALDAFVRASNKTQQSSSIDQLSVLQKSNPLVRGMTMFMSAPIAQFRGEVRANRQFWIKKEIGTKEYLKRMMIYHFLVPQVYRLVSNGLLFGEFDLEDQLVNAVFGSLAGMPIIGDIINYYVRRSMGKPVRGADAFKWSAPVKELGVDLWDALLAGAEGDFEEMTEALLDAGINGGTLVGAPTPQFENFTKAIEDIEDGNLRPAGMRFFGYPDSIARDAE